MRAQDPYKFSEGAVVRCVYSNFLYQVVKHKNGMTDMLCFVTGIISPWNSYNNQMFIPADFVSLGVQTLCYAN